MATLTKQRSRATLVTIEAVEQARQFLSELPDKPKDDLSLKEAIGHMTEAIQAALAKGYSYRELAGMLSQNGMKISEFTLKSYVPVGKRRNSKPKGRRSASTDSSDGVSETLSNALERDEPLDLEADAPEEVAAPKQRQSTKSAAAKTKTASTTAARGRTASSSRSTTAGKTASSRRRKSSAS